VRTKDNLIHNKSLDFAVRVVNLYKYLIKEKSEFVLSKQLLRSGTSIGANIRESISAESTADFIHKMAIAQKECDESLYWLELLQRTDYLTETEYNSIICDCTELKKLLVSIVLTTKQKKIQNS